MNEKIKKRILLIEKTALALVVICSITGGLIFGFITSEIKNYSGIHNLKKFQPSEPTRLLDVNGELIAELFQEKRDLASYEDLPPTLINAFLAAEDRDFHWSWRRSLVRVCRSTTSSTWSTRCIG